MNQDSGTHDSPASPAPRRWQPLSSIDRRVLGVLAEKAKTTPDIYPMSLNAICTGCNQKSNRSPLVEYEPDTVEESLDRLREFGVVTLVEGYGRVQKYRHHLYDWLGVDKVELAVMTELLLRGDQTVGELRGRASRMEPIADLAALGAVLQSLKSKGLVVGLTPEGRGHSVTHALYKPRELEEIKARYSVSGLAPSHTPPHAAPHYEAVEPVAQSGADHSDEVESLRRQMAEFRQELDELRAAHSETAERLRQLQESLGG